MSDKDCNTCVHNGKQCWYPSGCTGCGAHGERFNYVSVSNYKALSAVEQIELQKKVEELQAMIAMKDEALREVVESDFEVSSRGANRLLDLCSSALAATAESTEAWLREEKAKVLENMAAEFYIDGRFAARDECIWKAAELRKNGGK